MPVSSLGHTFAVLGAGTFEDLVGGTETAWLEFKYTGYRLEEKR